MTNLEVFGRDEGKGKNHDMQTNIKKVLERGFCVVPRQVLREPGLPLSKTFFVFGGYRERIHKSGVKRFNPS